MLLETLLASHTSNVCICFTTPKGKTGSIAPARNAPRVGAMDLTGPPISVIGVARPGQEGRHRGGVLNIPAGWLTGHLPPSFLCPCKHVAVLTSMRSRWTVFMHLPSLFGFLHQSLAKLLGIQAHLQAGPGSQGHSRPVGIRGVAQSAWMFGSIQPRP